VKKKQCGDCGEKKALRAFYRSQRGKHGRQSYCKLCLRIRDRAKRAANPDAWRERSWRHKGIDMTAARYAELLKEQQGECAICGVSQAEVNRRFAVDHDHTTGKIRGLLCGNCNKGLGLLGDTAEGVRAALDYLV
jgi:hypothetical protein